MGLVFFLLFFRCCFGAGLFILEGSQSKYEYLREGLERRGWKENTKIGYQAKSFGFKWTAHSFESPLSSRALINHFKNYQEFTSKDGLLNSLVLNAQSNHREFFPRCYSSKELSSLERDVQMTISRCSDVVFEESEEENTSQSIDCGTGKLWIVKPSSGEWCCV